MDRKDIPSSAAVNESTITDDFTLVKGIGPKANDCLHERDIHTFAQLAAMSPEQIAALVSDVPGTSAKRIARDDWIGQARQKDKESTPSEHHHGATSSRNRQHYATFTINLLLDADNKVRRTEMTHIQSGDKKPETYAGWDSDRLVEFIVQQAALLLPTGEPASAMAATAEADSRSAAPPKLTGKLHLQRLEMMPDEARGPRLTLGYGQPFTVDFTLDLTDVALPSDKTVEYTATVYAKDLSGGPRQTVGQTHGSVKSKDPMTIKLDGKPLPRGIYRLEAMASLALPTGESGPKAHRAGDILRVY
jgi:hypothetical protein